MDVVPHPFPYIGVDNIEGCCIKRKWTKKKKNKKSENEACLVFHDDPGSNLSDH